MTQKEILDKLQALIDGAVQKGLFVNSAAVIEYQQALNQLADILNYNKATIENLNKEVQDLIQSNGAGKKITT